MVTTEKTISAAIVKPTASATIVTFVCVIVCCFDAQHRRPLPPRALSKGERDPSSSRGKYAATHLAERDAVGRSAA